MIAYQVGNQFINNVYLALHTSWKTGNPVKFYCNDHEFDKFDWTIEPEASLDSLMSDYALRLRDTHERLILMWSGGTDSHTIYNIFKQNNIHIDEIIIKTEKGSIEFPEEHANWMREHHWDPTTIITQFDNFDKDLRLIELPNEDWVWLNKGDLLKYCLPAASAGVQFLCEKNHAGHDWRVINGFEKPRLVYRNGRWFSRQLAETLNQAMGSDRLIPFFLEPFIAIKQSHMLKRGVKHILAETNQPLYDADSAEAKWPRTVDGYRKWATAMGRHEELLVGTSHYQKMLNEVLGKTEIDITGNWKSLHITQDIRLEHDLTNGDVVAKNFIKGFHNIASEKGFMNFLRENGWFRHSDSCLTRLNFIWSKEYDLGP